MAWDKDRPIAPFYIYGENTIAYKRGEREGMEPFTHHRLTKSDVDMVWQNGKATYQELTGKDGWGGLEFRPFRDVELDLTYEGYSRGVSGITFWWRDKNNVRYPMFVAEIDRLIKSGIMSNKIGGLWSAEKRGRNYGIRLEKLLWRFATNADEQKSIS